MTCLKPDPCHCPACDRAAADISREVLADRGPASRVAREAVLAEHEVPALIQISEQLAEIALAVDIYRSTAEPSQLYTQLGVARRLAAERYVEIDRLRSEAQRDRAMIARLNELFLAADADRDRLLTLVDRLREVVR